MNTEEKKNQDRISSESISKINNPINLVEVKAPQMPKEISFPKEITFSDTQTQMSFNNETGYREVQARTEEVSRWTEPVSQKPKKHNRVPVCVAVVLVVIVLGVGTIVFFRNVAYNASPITTESIVAVQEEGAETMENKEQSETVESTENVDTTSESATAETRFIEDKENLGYNITYDSEKAEQMLDELEALYEQMPDVEAFVK